MINDKTNQSIENEWKKMRDQVSKMYRLLIELYEMKAIQIDTHLRCVDCLEDMNHKNSYINSQLRNNLHFKPSLSNGSKSPEVSNNEEWLCSLTEDGSWDACDHYASEEEAIAEGLNAIMKFNSDPLNESIDNEFGTTPEDEVTAFYVGKVSTPPVEVSVEELLEQMSDSAAQEYGEVADGYLNEVTDDDKKNLESLLSDWFTLKGYSPRWITVTKVRKVIVD